MCIFALIKYTNPITKMGCIKKENISMKNLILVLLLAILALFSSCDKLFEDDKLSLTREPYTGNELRMDGYYYETTGTRVLVFYRNGTVNDFGGINLNEMDQFEESMFTNQLRNLKSSWGVFQIKNDDILYERWIHSPPPSINTYFFRGKILNDTTYVINEMYRIKNGKKYDVSVRNDTYKFKKLDQKPDSTNQYIN